MKHLSFSYLFLFLQIICLVTFFGCSQESTGLVSTAYHNTTAHYNAYFLARQKINELETTLFKNRQDDYNRLLDIIQPLDSNIAKSQTAASEYIIQKASLAIQRHKNSKWVDDSYLLVGTAQFYQMDFPNALKAFKYVNTISKGKQERHQALINIFRTYVQMQEYSNAKAVVNFIKKENLSKENLAEFYLIRAQLHKQEQEYLQAAGTLALAVRLMPKNEQKARVHFVMGQIYEQLNNSKQAYKNFRSTLKNNPSYELSFYAKLHMLQSYEVGKNEDAKKALVYFKKMLRDEKNIDYKDKIYYQMGMYEAKRSNFKQAIKHLQTSVSASKDDIQKSYSYLKLGEIYFENLQDYELAKAYYDSTIQALPTTAVNYESIVKRQQVLDNFVQQVTTIQTEDSLQRLAKMDTASLDKYLDELFAKEEEQRKKIEAKQEMESIQQAGSIFANNEQTANNRNRNSSNGQNARWYFYNVAVVSQGGTAFARKWGNRPLEDNWRRSAKEASVDFSEPGQPATSDSTESTPVVSVENQNEEKKQQIIASLPSTPEAMAASNTKIEEAYFNLGKIYNLELQEHKNADSVFVTLLTRFPDSDFEPEALYFLYLIHKELAQPEQQEAHKNTLITKHPNSAFAKLISNPNYVQEGNMADAQVKNLYSNAYQYYEDRNYEEANNLVDQAIQQYPENSLTERLQLLKVLIIGRTQNKETFKKALTGFMEQYPFSSLIPYVENILRNTETVTGGIQRNN
ncbi:tetratricopeptide repeat protein [Rhodocytophaga aerolata]|uniref:Tetratricopeptide repeat protein n=1 Tax=Rhodocytophaga aerolata TaxID=455078 RepID=A0ABT8R934_9BACT|nr:tetratricopeptide repeat protein [Rhodocytophaga aerolata]MDO1448595.1 tetratricopeptide repeat protein [Rhodocytophaga aerolata]